MVNVPIVYTFIYMKVKDKSRTSVIHIDYLKEIIGRTIIRRGGIPRFMVKYVINDLISMGLIERLAYNQFKIRESSCDKKVKQLMSSYC